MDAKHKPLQLDEEEDGWVVIKLNRIELDALINWDSQDFFQVDLRDKSEILTDDFCSALLPSLPERLQVVPWNLAYSSSIHGSSLTNLYRKVSCIDMPTMVVIKDIEDHIFGVVTSCPPKMTRHFCGNGESLVFSFHKDLKVYRWTRDCNYNIIKGSVDCVAVGCDSGASALWLDSDLYRGRTEACSSFHSDALCPCGDFLSKVVEVWVLCDNWTGVCVLNGAGSFPVS